MIAVLAVVAALEGCGSSSRRDPPSLPYKTRVAMLVSQTRQLFSTAAYAVDELAAGGQPQAQQTLRQIQRRAERLVQDADNQLSSVSPVGSVIEQASTVVSSVAHTLQGPRAGSLSAGCRRDRPLRRRLTSMFTTDGLTCAAAEITARE